MHSAITFLAEKLELGVPQTTLFVISCFNDYAFDFLLNNPNVLDPDLAQIRARIHLTMAHRPVGWLWTQQMEEAKEAWGQEEHAAAFVLRVLDYLYALGHFPNDCPIDAAVNQIHQRLCVLQSVCLGDGTWVEDAGLQSELRRALAEVMGEIECANASSFTH
ncbi:hypothetical protein C8A01DRAFT_43234 [Parachaetomium inaequale]|uniref:Uncharacterized protein n=1 Tax=Parachaetomium inaequale TaxID=2588326 RepID=A0AAN6PPY5_9PEZI|nr:hypothetical protein C8A01DRAFT_43234 [Parachaetomium inaequale]